IGGHMTPALGFASGAERLIAVMKARDIKIPEKKERRIFIAHAGELAKKKSFALVRMLRAEGIRVSESLARESLAAQLKVANKEELSLALIMGQREIYEDAVIMRDLKNGTQESVQISRVVAEIKKRL